MAERFTQMALLLFAITTLISQSAMDAFATLFALGFIGLAMEKKTAGPGFCTLKWGRMIGAWIGLTLISYAVNWSAIEPRRWFKMFDFRWLLIAAMVGSFLIWKPITTRALKILEIAFLFCSSFAILVFFLKRNPLVPQYTLDLLADGTVRSGGFLLQPIVFAHLYGLWICIMAGILLVQLNFEPRQILQKKNAWLIAALTVGLVAILLSFTRGVWLSLFFAILAMMFLLRWRWALAFVIAGAAAVAIISMAWSTVGHRLLEAIQGRDVERLWIWNANFNMFLDHPWFGVGYGRNVDLLREYLDQIQAPAGLMISHAHNQFLHILVGTGVFGFLAYLGFWFFVLAAALRAYRAQRTQDLLKAGVALGLFAAVISFWLSGMTESNLEHSKIRYTWALLVGLLIWVSSPVATTELPKK